MGHFIFFLCLFILSIRGEKWYALVKGTHRLTEREDLKIKITHHFLPNELNANRFHQIEINQITDWSSYKKNEYEYDSSYLKVYQFEGNQKDIIHSLYGNFVTREFGDEILFLERNLPVRKQQTCRTAPSGGNVGFKPGYFSWGLDIIDSRSSTMDLQFCPASGTLGGDGAHIFILDTGFSNPVPNHVTSSNIILEADFYPNGVFCRDLDQHGTNTGCLIVSNIYGVAPNAKLHVYKVLNDEGEGNLSDILNALIQILISPHSNGIISMSLGVYMGTTVSPSLAIDSVLHQLMNDKNFIVIAAAGNSGANSCFNYPSNVNGVISVGAVGLDLRLAWFTNRGECTSLFAPGVSIISGGISPPNYYTTYSGTSQACPIVAGVTALYKTEYGISTSRDIIIHHLLNFSTVNAIRGLDANSPNKLVYVGSFSFQTDPPPAAPSLAHSFKQSIITTFICIIIFYLIK